LPNGSYENISIKCDSVKNKSKISECNNFVYGVNCTCNNLVGGTEFKIKFITRKKDWNDSVSELAKNENTSIYKLFCFLII
jgi:hypothetical protein